MGFFGGGWDKPGPGVDKDAPKKKGIFLYTEIFLRKFWNIIHLNVIYFAVSILFIVLLYLTAPVPQQLVNTMADTAISQQLTQTDGEGDNGAASDPEGEQTSDSERETVVANLQVGLRSMYAVILFTLWGCAPMAAGYSYVARCFTREQHAWVWSDFVDKVKENFRQSIMLFVGDIVVLLLATVAMPFYYLSYLSTGQYTWLIICSFLSMMLFVYTMMHYYIYQLMITFKCTLKQLYKNSFMLAVGKLPMNVLFTVIAIALDYVIFMLLSPAVAVGLTFFIWVSMVRFPIEFYSARVIEKVIINDAESKIDSREDER